MKRLFFSLAILLAFAATAKSQNYTPEKTKNLTVVYFVPSDYTVSPSDYQDRLSKVLNYIQDWYSQQMKNNGYVDANGNGKTFGLVKDASTKMVDIVQINAPSPSSSYSSYTNIKTAVDNYFTLNPTRKTGKHVLVFYPNGMTGPYTGYNQYTIVNDDPVKTNINKIGTTDVAGLGGPAHELGHGFNLPHDSGTKSDYANPARGTSLMGAGVYNFTVPGSPAFLTANDCAILNVCEPFNENPSTPITYNSVNSTLTSVHTVYDATSRIIKVSGKFFNGGVPVNSVLVYNDPNYYVTNGDNQGFEGVGTNVDYNAITWETKPIGIDSFYVDIPIDEFIIKYPYEASGTDPFNYPYEMKFKFVHTNGFVEADNGGAGGTVRNTYYFTFANGVPVLPFSIPINNSAVSRNNWTVIAGTKSGANTTFLDQSAASGAGFAGNVIDNDYTTYWRSKTTGFPAGGTNVFPHEIIIDTKSAENYVGWSCHQLLGLNYAVKNVEIQGSDDNTNFTSIGTYTVDAKEGVKYFNFDSFKKFRYFKIKVLTGTTSSAGLADIKLYLGPNPANIVPVNPSILVSNFGWTVKAGTKIKADGVTTFEDENNATTSGNERAEDIIDNNTTTYWHSQYSGLTAAEQTFPHQIIIDTKSVQRFTDWSYNQRVGSGQTRHIKDVEISVSNDDVTYTLVGNYTLLDNVIMNKISFGARNFRYFKIVALNAYDNDKFASLAEVNLYNDLNEGPLPVVFTAFNAKNVSNTVKLNWTTASENNSAYFDLLRFTDKGNPISIGKISAAGTSSTNLTYNYTDYNPLPGTSYYQLNQYDKDGKLGTQSGVRTISVLEKPYELTIQSVTGNEVKFNVYSASAGETSFYITNMLGQRLTSKTINLTAGNNQLSLPVNSIGLNVLTADFKTQVISKKFIK